jgi:hypothetical protein
MTEIPGFKCSVTTAVDGKTPADDIHQPAFLHPPGTVLHLDVHRGSETHAVDVTLKDIL